MLLIVSLLGLISSGCLFGFSVVYAHEGMAQECLAVGIAGILGIVISGIFFLAFTGV